MKDRERVIHGGHPPYCSCVECNDRRLARIGLRSSRSQNPLITRYAITYWVCWAIAGAIISVLAWRIYLTFS